VYYGRNPRRPDKPLVVALGKSAAPHTVLTKRYNDATDINDKVYFARLHKEPNVISVVSSELHVDRRPQSVSVNWGILVPAGTPIIGCNKWTEKEDWVVDARIDQKEKLRLIGTVTLNGNAGPGWQVGYLQAEYSREINWAYYQGLQHSDGSALIDRSSLGDCFDAGGPGSRLFGSGGPSYMIAEVPQSLDSAVTLSVTHEDGPGDQMPHAVQNKTAGGKINFLREWRFDAQFCTCLVVRGPDENVQFLHHILWTVSWWLQFDPPAPGFHPDPNLLRQLPPNVQFIPPSWDYANIKARLVSKDLTPGMKAVEGKPDVAHGLSTLTPPPPAVTCRGRACKARERAVQESSQWKKFRDEQKTVE
jgi:hypothetical protein